MLAYPVLPSHYAYMHHVAILHNVLLALKAKRTLRARSCFAARRKQIIPANRFGANEVMLKIGVNRAGRLRRLRSCGNSPCAAFVFACGEEADEPSNS